MTRPRIANCGAREYVNARKPFANYGGTLTAYEQATADRHVYVVMSYGPHFPIYVYDYPTGEWYGNSDRYSQTTSNHQNRARPTADIKWVDTKTMRATAAYGVAGAVAKMLRSAA
jgi:hypothetical protein